MEQEKISANDTAKVFCEEWRPIKGYEGQYEVSNHGRIKSLSREENNRTLKDRIMKQYVGKTGYMQVRLCKNNQTKLWKVHDLIAKSFIENPYDFPIVNHKDGNKINNDISNLEWCSYSHNIKHAYRTGLRMMRPIEQRTKDGSFVKKWDCATDASKGTGINLSHIWGCCNHQRKSAGGFKWQYIQ